MISFVWGLADKDNGSYPKYYRKYKQMDMIQWENFSYCYRYPQKFQSRKKVESNSIHQVASIGLQDIRVNLRISKFHTTIMHNHFIFVASFKIRSSYSYSYCTTISGGMHGTQDRYSYDIIWIGSVHNKNMYNNVVQLHFRQVLPGISLKYMQAGDHFSFFIISFGPIHV